MGARALFRGRRGMTTEQLTIIIISIIIFISLLYIVRDQLATILVLES